MPAQTAGFTLSIAAERIVGVDEASCLLMPSPTAACNSGYIYRNAGRSRCAQETCRLGRIKGFYGYV